MSTTVSNVRLPRRSSTIENARRVMGEPGVKASTSALAGSCSTIVEKRPSAGNCGAARISRAAASISGAVSGSSGCGAAAGAADVGGAPPGVGAGWVQPANSTAVAQTRSPFSQTSILVSGYRPFRRQSLAGGVHEPTHGEVATGNATRATSEWSCPRLCKRLTGGLPSYTEGHWHRFQGTAAQVLRGFMGGSIAESARV